MPCTWTVGPGPAWLADCVLASAAGAAVSVAPATANPASQDFKVIRGLPSCGEWTQPLGIELPHCIGGKEAKAGTPGRNGDRLDPPRRRRMTNASHGTGAGA